MRRILTLLALAAVVAAGTAQAQVAVPELVPAAPRYYNAGELGFNSATITADNPAALQWGEPSRVAFGLVELDEERLGPPAQTDNYSGNFVGGRGVWDPWALAVEHLAVDDDNSDGEETATSAHLSYRVTDALAIGAGIDQAERSGGMSKDEVTGNTFGLAINLDDRFYLGYALGRDSYEDQSGVTGDRDTAMLGFAVRFGDSWRWHLAYDTLDKDQFDTPTPGGGFDATTITAQVGLGDFVLGAQSVEVEPKGGGSLFEATVIDFGWAPESGLTLTARMSDGETTSNGPVTITHDGLSVTVGYQF